VVYSFIDHIQKPLLKPRAGTLFSLGARVFFNNMMKKIKVAHTPASQMSRVAPKIAKVRETVNARIAKIPVSTRSGEMLSMKQFNAAKKKVMKKRY
jgi:hypothetical protein